MISPGKIVYSVYYKPLNQLSQLLRRGVLTTAKLEKGRRDMKAAASELREVVYSNENFLTVYFLTGKKYWYQTAFCLYTLQKQSGHNIQAMLVDDGSFDEMLLEEIRKNFPTSTKVVMKNELLRLLDQRLPEGEFPTLRKRRTEYPHLRKLTDVHILPGPDYKLVLDSDMLFFHEPSAIVEWLLKPSGCLFMRDAVESYGYSLDLMQSLTGATSFPERLNVGVAGLASSSIHWEKLEDWTRTLLAKEGSSYLQEQALTAMIVSNQSQSFLNEKEYKVLPKITGNCVPEVLHHYVADAKYDYFAKGWKLALA